MIKDSEIVSRIKEIFEEAQEGTALGEYPKEALPLGTYARTKRQDRLGIIADAYYDDVDQDNQKIIVYTIILLPDPFILPSSPAYETRSQVYISNEYEYT